MCSVCLWFLLFLSVVFYFFFFFCFCFFFFFFFFFSSRRRHTRSLCDWSSDVCSSDLVALLVLAYEKDVGTSLLFFGVFAAMLYITTQRPAYLIGTFVLLVIGAFVAYKSFGHVQVRVRSEERRVGKECRCRGAAYHVQE